ncbi:unnamed protein product [Rhodiola kirilowii]
MKASLKFRDEQTPLLRAKVPLNVLNLHFQSGIVAGHSKELSLQLSTFFDSGPSLKLAYKPNDACKPFSLVVKIGTGKYGSPIDSSMVMSAEFDVVGRGGNPRFFVHFKPRFGDFGIRKKQSSTFGERKEDDNSIDVLQKPKIDQGYMPQNFGHTGLNKVQSVPSASSVADRLLTGVELSAATTLPVLSLANVKIQWGLRVPTEMKNMFAKEDGLFINRSPAISFKNIPFLAMNKISVEHARGTKHQENSAANSEVLDKDDVSMMVIGVRHQLEASRDENRMLRKVVEDMRSEICSGKMNPFAGEIKHREAGRVAGNKYRMDCKTDIKSVDQAVEGKKN